MHLEARFLLYIILILQDRMGLLFIGNNTG